MNYIEPITCTCGSRDLTLCAPAAIRRAGAAGTPAMSNIAELVTAGERLRIDRNWRTFGPPRLPPSATNGTGKAPEIWCRRGRSRTLRFYAEKWLEILVFGSLTNSCTKSCQSHFFRSSPGIARTE